MDTYKIKPYPNEHRVSFMQRLAQMFAMHRYEATSRRYRKDKNLRSGRKMPMIVPEENVTYRHRTTHQERRFINNTRRLGPKAQRRIDAGDATITQALQTYVRPLNRGCKLIIRPLKDFQDWLRHADIVSSRW